MSLARVSEPALNRYRQLATRAPQSRDDQVRAYAGLMMPGVALRAGRADQAEGSKPSPAGRR